ncbi:hypothetical protein AVEN_163829-1 [Araneus ventricosus]|uniref:Uncharacterized protein n=1 Tax=Araneus ventricosus TaxID=182803 RepID=A0A4Y2WIS1_ARAVE|nr:hypothetical protein AVEN_163829-1 [Araneus ventricosus]
MSRFEENLLKLTRFFRGSSPGRRALALLDQKLNFFLGRYVSKEDHSNYEEGLILPLLDDRRHSASSLDFAFFAFFIKSTADVEEVWTYYGLYFLILVVSATWTCLLRLIETCDKYSKANLSGIAYPTTCGKINGCSFLCVEDTAQSHVRVVAFPAVVTDKKRRGALRIGETRAGMQMLHGTFPLLIGRVCHVDHHNFQIGRIVVVELVVL